MLGRGFEALHGDAVVLREVAVGHPRAALFGKVALHQVFGVLAQLGNIVRAHEAADDEEAVLLEASILLDTDTIPFAGRSIKRRCIGCGHVDSPQPEREKE